MAVSPDSGRYFKFNSCAILSRRRASSYSPRLLRTLLISNATDSLNCHGSSFSISGILARIASSTFISLLPFLLGSEDWNISRRNSSDFFAISACSFAFASFSCASFSPAMARCSLARASSALRFASSALALAFASFSCASFSPAMARCSLARASSALRFASSALALAFASFSCASCSLAVAARSARIAQRVRAAKPRRMIAPISRLSRSSRIRSASTVALIFSRLTRSM